jgi:hypothetical protein
MKYKDYYQTLGVARDASKDEIKKAYRRLARKFHPNVSKETGAEEKFKAVNEANDVLSDPRSAPPTISLVRTTVPATSFVRRLAGAAGNPARISPISFPSCSAGEGKRAQGVALVPVPRCQARISRRR